MRTGWFLVALVLASSLSCSRDTVFTLASLSGDTVLVSEDRETMERLIECAVTGACGGLSARALLAARKVFRVPCGTKVTLRDGFTLAKTRSIRVLDGEYAGKDGWVYERMLIPDRGSLSLAEDSEDRTTPLAYVSDSELSSVFLDTYR